MENADNRSMSRFSAAYWRSAVKECRSLKSLVTAALFVALNLAISQLFIPLPVLGTQRIYFTFFVKALGAIIYGPIVGMLAGMIGDLIGAILMPTGPFFFGYTITAMLGSFLYGLFLYKARLSVLRIALCKASINIFLNVLLNSLWSAVLMGNGYWLLVIARLPKNIIMLPLEILLLVLFFRSMLPILKKEKILNCSQYELRIKWL